MTNKQPTFFINYLDRLKAGLNSTNAALLKVNIENSEFKGGPLRIFFEKF